MTTHVSPCCAAPVRVEGDEIYWRAGSRGGKTLAVKSHETASPSMGSRYFVCQKCGQPCDPVKGEE